MTPASPGDVLDQGICIHATHSSKESRNHLQQARDSTEKARMLLTSKTQHYLLISESPHSTQQRVSPRARPGPSPGSQGLPYLHLAIPQYHPA